MVPQITCRCLSVPNSQVTKFRFRCSLALLDDVGLDRCGVLVCAASGQAGRRAIKNGGHLRAQKCHVVHKDLGLVGLEPPKCERDLLKWVSLRKRWRLRYTDIFFGGINLVEVNKFGILNELKHAHWSYMKQKQWGYYAIPTYKERDINQRKWGGLGFTLKRC